jgi:hypothetical protein
MVFSTMVKPWLVQVYATIHKLVKAHLHLVGIVLKKHKHAYFQANCWPFTLHEKNFLHIDSTETEIFHKKECKK